MIFRAIFGIVLLLNQFNSLKGITPVQEDVLSSSFLNADFNTASFFGGSYEIKNNLGYPDIGLNNKSLVAGVNFNSFYFLPLETVSLPLIKKEAKDIEIGAKAAIAADLLSGKVLYEKNPITRLPIASLTKLVTALVVADEVKNFDDKVTVSVNAVKTIGDSGKLAVQEKISVKNLMYLMLVSSSNDAAMALAEYVGGGINNGNNGEKDNNGDFDSKIGDFVKLLNNKTKSLALDNTNFSNPAGLDEKENYSTAQDIVKIIRYIFNDSDANENGLGGKKIIRDIIKTDQITVYSDDKKIAHYLKSTNKLLSVIPNILGGKTGYTDEAGESLVLIVSDSSGRHSIVTVVLNAEDRFEQTKKLADWTFNSYVWKE